MLKLDKDLAEGFVLFGTMYGVQLSQVRFARNRVINFVQGGPLPAQTGEETNPFGRS